MPPSRAIAIAIRASVTVSMAADSSGTATVISRVSREVVSTSEGMTSVSPGAGAGRRRRSGPAGPGPRRSPSPSSVHATGATPSPGGSRPPRCGRCRACPLTISAALLAAARSLRTSAGRGLRLGSGGLRVRLRVLRAGRPVGPGSACRCSAGRRSDSASAAAADSAFCGCGELSLVCAVRRGPPGPVEPVRALGSWDESPAGPAWRRDGGGTAVPLAVLLRDGGPGGRLRRRSGLQGGALPWLRPRSPPACAHRRQVRARPGEVAVRNLGAGAGQLPLQPRHPGRLAADSSSPVTAETMPR